MFALMGSGTVLLPAHIGRRDYQAAADMPKDLRQEMISEWVRRAW